MRIVFLVLGAVFLNSCNFNPTDISEKIILSLTQEKKYYEVLKSLEIEIKKAPAQSETKRDLLVKNSDALKEYLDILYSLEEALKPIKEKTRSNTEYHVESFLKNDKNKESKTREIESFSAIWDESNRALLSSFLDRESGLEIQLPSWAFESLQKQTQDISFLKFKEKTSLEISFSENVIPFLNMIFGPKKYSDLSSVFVIQLTEDKDFANTLPSCRDYAKSLVDEDCQLDAASACGPQMTDLCMRDVFSRYAQADCRKRDRKYLSGEIVYVPTTKFDKLENGSSEELVTALKACDFKELVF